jgi:hypothetical protein
VFAESFFIESSVMAKKTQATRKGGGLRDFWCGLMVFISRPGKVSKSVWYDMYLLRDGLDESGEYEAIYGSAYEMLCFVALRLSKSFGVRLPDELHNRMVLGPQNEKTVQYVRFIGKLAAHN